MFRAHLCALSCVAALAVSSCARQPAESPAASSHANPGVNVATRSGNHLVAEKSPYLQRHAQNPVDWYPWGPEAFEKARRENKLIFLSVGYSTCHWCHVMEEESFTNPAIAAVMNRHFVSIKVDREERPDVDRVYLAYVTSVSSGGWPMSVVLTPDLKPFFGATYLPPETRDDQEGLRPVMERLAGAWQTKRALVLKAAADGSSIVNGIARIPPPASARSGVRDLDDTYTSLSRSFDRVDGGFGGAPKFPRPVVLNFLLRHYARTKTQAALDMTLATLRAMAGGAIHDHLDGGFHRYTVDAAWRVPHFEKMLYDQAQLSAAYADAYQVSRDETLAAVARSTLDYVLRQLRDNGGGFCSAEDADSRVSKGDGRLAEGAFYLWTLDDLQRVLGRDAPLVAYYFDVTAAGHLGSDAGADRAGANALTARHTVGETASQFKTTEQAAQKVLDTAITRLRAERDARPRPARDDKIITAWNGLMISALARGHVVLDDRRYLDAALDAARFIEAHLVNPSSSSLKRRYVEGNADIDGLPDDYAFFIQGLLDLFEASFDPHWLSLAIRLQATQDRLFWDDKDGAYFSTRADAAHLLARMKEDYDGAEPAANSVAAMNLVRLWQLTDADAWRSRADATFRAMSGRVARSGTAVPQLMAALDFRQAKAKQIVIAGEPGAADTRALLRLVHDRFIPNKVLAVVDGGAQQAELGRLAPPLADMPRRDGRATIYVCENYTCHLPTTDTTVAARLLDGR